MLWSGNNGLFFPAVDQLTSGGGSSAKSPGSRASASQPCSPSAVIAAAPATPSPDRELSPYKFQFLWLLRRPFPQTTLNTRTNFVSTTNYCHSKALRTTSGPKLWELVEFSAVSQRAAHTARTPPPARNSQLTDKMTPQRKLWAVPSLNGINTFWKLERKTLGNVPLKHTHTHTHTPISNHTDLPTDSTNCLKTAKGPNSRTVINRLLISKHQKDSDFVNQVYVCGEWRRGSERLDVFSV